MFYTNWILGLNVIWKHVCRILHPKLRSRKPFIIVYLLHKYYFVYTMWQQRQFVSWILKGSAYTLIIWMFNHLSIYISKKDYDISSSYTSLISAVNIINSSKKIFFFLKRWSFYLNGKLWITFIFGVIILTNEY